MDGDSPNFPRNNPGLTNCPMSPWGNKQVVISVCRLHSGWLFIRTTKSRCDESLTDVKGGSATLGEEETQLTRSHDMHLPADSHTVDALPGLAWSD